MTTEAFADALNDLAVELRQGSPLDQAVSDISAYYDGIDAGALRRAHDAIEAAKVDRVNEAAANASKAAELEQRTKDGINAIVADARAAMLALHEHIQRHPLSPAAANEARSFLMRMIRLQRTNTLEASIAILAFCKSHMPDQDAGAWISPLRRPN